MSRRGGRTRAGRSTSTKRRRETARGIAEIRKIEKEHDIKTEGSTEQRLKEARQHKKEKEAEKRQEKHLEKTGLGKIADKSKAIGDEWLAFGKDQFEQASQRQAGIDAQAQELSARQMGEMDRFSGWATEDRDRYNTLFRPIEDQFAETARTWGSEENQANAAAQAKADVFNNAQAMQHMQQRDMARMGVDPRSGRAAEMNRATSMQTGLAAAGAQNNARDMVRREGLEMQGQAIDLGLGLSSRSHSNAVLGSQMGQAAQGTTLNAHDSFLDNQGMRNQAYAGGLGAYGQAGDILNGVATRQAQQAQANAAARAGNRQAGMTAIGTIASAALIF
jgi:hypothetical protein